MLYGHCIYGKDNYFSFKVVGKLEGIDAIEVKRKAWEVRIKGEELPV